jgi:hypothetical protein
MEVVGWLLQGMANYNKNMFIGVGGREAINLSHFIGAVYGMERMMGVADNPLRRVLNHASEKFLGKIPLIYFLTVIGEWFEVWLVREPPGTSPGIGSPAQVRPRRTVRSWSRVGCSSAMMWSASPRRPACRFRSTSPSWTSRWRGSVRHTEPPQMGLGTDTMPGALSPHGRFILLPSGGSIPG